MNPGILTHDWLNAETVVCTKNAHFPVDRIGEICVTLAMNQIIVL